MHVDRLLFTHQGGRDFTVSASSLERAQWQTWEQRLRLFVRGGGSTRPATSIRYWCGGGNAAILRRTRGRGDNRTDSCQILVGNDRLLTHRTALATHGWPGWEASFWSTGSNPLPEVSGGEVNRLNQSSPSTWLDDAGNELLLWAVGALLRDPRRPLVLVSFPFGIDPAVAFLAALFDIVENLLHGLSWTFSTYETSYDDELPRIAFLPSGFYVSRNHPIMGSVIQADEPPILSEQHLTVAKALVDIYRGHDGWQALNKWLNEHDVLQPALLDDRVARLLAVPQLGEPVRRLPAARPTPDTRAPSVHITTHDDEPAWGDDIQLLLALDTPDSDPRQVLAEIRRREQAESAHRAEVRRHLLTNPEWVERLSASVPPAEANEAVDTVIDFAIPASDLLNEEVAGEVTWIQARLPLHTPLCLGLARHLFRHNAFGIFHLAQTYRICWAAGWEVPESVVKPAPSQRPEPERPVPEQNPVSGDNQLQVGQEFQSVGSESGQEFRSVGSESGQQFRPFGVQRGQRSVGSESGQEFRPFGVQRGQRPVGSESGQEFRSVGSESGQEFQPLGSQQGQEFQSVGSQQGQQIQPPGSRQSQLFQSPGSEQSQTSGIPVNAPLRTGATPTPGPGTPATGLAGHRPRMPDWRGKASAMRNQTRDGRVSRPAVVVIALLLLLVVLLVIVVF
jgi:hypothetical protein